MTDTLRTRVSRVIASSAHAFLARIEDATPVAMMEQSLREIDSVIADVRTELGRTVANRHLAQQQHLHLNEEHDSLCAQLTAALSASRDDLARPAISRQIDIEAQLPILETSLVGLSQDEKDLSGFIDALMGKKREMERALAEFERSRQQASSATRDARPAAHHAAARAEAAQSSFDRTYRRQTGLDRSAMTATMAQATKLKELFDLARDNKINERLATLKAQQSQ